MQLKVLEAKGHIELADSSHTSFEVNHESNDLWKTGRCDSISSKNSLWKTKSDLLNFIHCFTVTGAHKHVGMLAVALKRI